MYKRQGKNPLTHVGKLYNIGASLIAAALVDEIPDLNEAECRLVSRIGGPIDERPSEIFKRHVYVAPFLDVDHEAKISELVELIGADHVLFGSDWPHGEGRDTPRHFGDELSDVSEPDLHKVLRSNTAELLGLDPVRAPSSIG